MKKRIPILAALYTPLALATQFMPAPIENLPIVEIILRIPSGYREDPQGKAGLAALLRSTLELGPVAKQAEALGMVRVSDLDADGLIFRVQGLESDALALTQILWSWVFDARVLSESAQVELARSLLLERVRLSQEDPEQKAFHALAKKLWMGTRLEKGPASYPQEIRTVSAADLRQYHARFFDPSRAQLWVIAQSTVQQQIQAAWRAKEQIWVKPTPLPVAAGAPKVNAKSTVQFKFSSKGSVENISVSGTTPSVILMGTRLARPAPVQLAAYYVANALLGEGTQSRLVRRIRDAQLLVYGLQSGLQFFGGDHPGRDDAQMLWVLRASTTPPVTAALHKKLLSAVSELCTGPIAAAELESARAVAASALAALRASSRNWIFQEMEIPEFGAVQKAIHQVTVEQVLAALHQGWANPRVQTVILGNQELMRATPSK